MNKYVIGIFEGRAAVDVTPRENWTCGIFVKLSGTLEYESSGWFNKVFFIVRLIYFIKQLYNETLLSGFKCRK